MSDTTELETLAVKLIADASQYTSTLRAAEKDIMSTANVMKAQSADLAKSLEFQAKTFHMTAREASIYALQLEGATKSQLSAAKAADKELTALEKERESLSKSNQLMLATVDYTTQLRLQAKTIGMTAREAAIYKLQLAGMSEGSLKAARDTDKLLTALEKEQKVVEELKGHNEQAVRYTKSLQEQAKTFGMSARSAEIYRQRVLGVDAATIKSMQVANRRLTQMEKEAQLITRGKDVTKQFQTTQTTFNHTMKELDKLLAKNAISMTTYTKAAAAAKKELGTGWDTIANAMKPADSAMASVGQRMQGIGRNMSMYVTAPLAGIGAMSVYEFGKFDQAMTEAFAIMGPLGADVRSELKSIAKEMSLTSKFSPDQLAGGLKGLAAAGLDAKQSMAALGVVERFATAGAFDLDKATQLLMDSQAALGMVEKDEIKNRENMIKVSDALVKAGDQSTASPQQFAEALANGAADAKNFGMELHTTMAILDAYASKGNKGASAGSDLARATRLIGKAVREHAGEWKNLGIQALDPVTGEFRNMIDIVKDMEGAFKGMTGPQRAATLELMGFEALAQSAILPLIGMSDQMKEWEEAQKKVTGYTKNVAGEQMKSFNNQITMLWNTLKVVGIEIGLVLVPYLTKLAGWLKDTLEHWRGFSKEAQMGAIAALAVVAAIGPLIATGGTVLIVLAQMKAALVLLTGAKVAATVASVALNSAMGALALGGIALVAYGIYQAMPAIQEWNAALAESKRLEEELLSATAKRNAAVLTKANGMGGEEKKDFLTNEIEQAEKSLRGMETRVRTTKEEVASLNTTWNGATGNKMLAGARQDLAEYEADLKLQKQHVLELKAAIDSPGAAAGASTSEKGSAMSPASIEATADVDELTKKLKEQIATFGMTTEAAKIHALEVKGATKEQIAALTVLQEQFNKLENEKKAVDKTKEFDKQITDMKAEAAMYGKEAHEIKLYKAELEGATEAQLAEMRTQNEMLNVLDKDKKLRERATALLKKHKTPAKEFEETQNDLKEMLDKGLISLADYNEELIDAEKQMKKEYKVEFKVAGIDAVEAGSAEAMSRLMAFQALRPGQVKMPGVDSLNLGGSKSKFNLQNGGPKFDNRDDVRARTVADKRGNKDKPGVVATRSEHENRIESLLALIAQNTAPKQLAPTINIKPSRIGST